MYRPGLTLALLLLAPLTILLAMFVGSVQLGWSDIRQALAGEGAGIAATLIFELRLPRALGAFAVGGMLALSGTLLQVLLRNPLADPYILGVSGGAAVAAMLSMLFGLGAGWVMGGALGGSLLSMVLVFGLAHARGAWTPMRLLLTGVVVAAGWGAVISFILAISPNHDLHGMLFWHLGDLSHGRHPLIGNLVLLTGLVLSFPLARALNLLARGELTAAALGENPLRLKIAVYFIASLLTAAAVSIAGSIGFVGLIIPHLLRLIGGSDHRLLLPNAALLGGSFLVVADTLARTVLAPVQLPVGVITALLGVPVFLYLLNRGQQP